MTDTKQKEISDLTHDLRAKLFAMTGYAEALQSGLAATEDAQKKYLAALKLSADHMTYLLDMLSAVNREGTLVLHPRPQNISDLIRNFFTARADELSRKHISLSLDLSELSEISVDSGAFSRILENLLQNTMKYKNKPETKISVTLSQKGNDAVLSYHDDGPGVSDTALPHLFEEGYREHPEMTHGEGRGLSIIQNLISLHGGTVSAKNENGLTVTLKIPMQGGRSC